MPAEDPVNTTALIFTEWELYGIVGYVAERYGWKLGDDNEDMKLIETIEKGIEEILSMDPPK